MLHLFKSTKPNSHSENRKASIKNHNLPILQYLYMGSRDAPLACLITKTPAFIETKDFGNIDSTKVRFRLDFNHIRQKPTDKCHSGVSLDKCTRAPSAIFRETRFDDDYVQNSEYLIEFMTIMPICSEMHSYISQDSAKNAITLKSFDHNEWPWVLQSEENFNQFCKDLNLPGLNYKQFIEHLSDIDQPPLQQRLKWDRSSRSFYMV